MMVPCEGSMTMKFMITIQLSATDDATPEKVAAFVNSALADFSDQDDIDEIAGFDGIWSNATVVTVP